MKFLTFNFVRQSALAGAFIFGLGLPVHLFAAAEERFDTPDEAVTALRGAAVAADTNALEAIFGPKLRELMSPDAVQSSNGLVIFQRRLSEKVNLDRESDSKIVLQLGLDGWPFPIPLKEKHDKWFFDTAAGKEEILNRRIGMDELATIDVCHSYVQAQHEYASADRNNDQVLEFAQHLRSSPGTEDGLYWHVEPGDESSPLGPLIAESHGEGYGHDTKILNDPQKPYHGYYFKILTAQGSHAPGGKYNYIINGHMIGGFALVAWPAEWGNSGVMTFIVNQRGQVYQKNLGSRTASKASRMKFYDPDSSWKLAEE